MSRVTAVGDYLVQHMPAMLEELCDLVYRSFTPRVAGMGRKATDPAAFVRHVERAFFDEVTMFFHDIVAALDRKVCVIPSIDYANEEIVLELHDNRHDPAVILVRAPDVVAPVNAAMARVAKQHIADRRHVRQRAANINA